MLTFLNLEYYEIVGFRRQDVGLIRFYCHTYVDESLMLFMVPVKCSI